MAGGATPGTDRQVIDGVAAVVGNEVILMSDVMQQLSLYARQNRGVNPQDPEVQRQVLNAIIDEKLVLTRAREDSIVITDDELNRAVDRQIETIVAKLGSEKRAEETYGMSMARIRQESREIIRQQFLAERERQRRFADLKLTESDLESFYQAYKDSIPQVPEQVELQSIVLLAKPSAEAKKATFDLARSIIDSLKHGGDFADFARRYSIDPGSASAGGDLGFVEKGKFVKSFEDAAAKLGPNDISDPVESEYGIHIIQVLERRGDATHSRHILLPITQSDAERDSMVAKLADLRRRALNGENFADLARKYSEDEDSRGLGGSLGKIPVDQLPPDTKPKMDTMKEGDITEPQQVAISPTEQGYQIIRLVRRIPPHKLDPQEDRAQLERVAQLYKQNEEYGKWIAELRKDIYWEIKNNF
jgi:peptidyl-prolyl cis-trans isomerase SurA